MSDSTEPAIPEEAPAQRPRRVLLLLSWFGLLAAIVAILKVRGGDPGFANSMSRAAIGLGALGFAIWSLRNSGWPVFAKLFVGFTPLALVAAFFLQILPVEAVLDGDVGIVGWRWRGSEPDKNLEVPESSEQSQLDWQTTSNDYPRFLGNGYWAEVHGVTLETDWEANSPKLLWKKEIGAGWSSFSIVGRYAVTQEQRGEEELVTCYEVETGEIVWTHSDPVRWDPRGAGSLGYAGPRATPTIHEGRVFSQGATGILNCIDASTGKLIWSHDTAAKHDAEVVIWGKSCSPLIVNQMVVVSVGGEENQSLVAYDIESGDVVWTGGDYQSSYASPIYAVYDGVPQVVSVNEGFVTGHDATDGKVLWEYEWPSRSDAQAAVSQPVPLGEDLLFLSKGYSHGSAVVQVKQAEDGKWETKPMWKGRQYGELPVMKTKMGNVVIRDGFVYGLNEGNLQCVDLANGKKQWMKRRRPKLGNGQIMLIGDVILILSEPGEVVLVQVDSKKYQELASMQVFPDTPITWNNPAFSAPYLLVRNAEEVACYELPLKEILATN